MISCATTKNSNFNESNKKNTTNNKLIVRGIENPEKLEKNDVMSVTNNVANPEYFEFSNWSKIRIMNSLLNELNLHCELTNEQKYKTLEEKTEAFQKFCKGCKNCSECQAARKNVACDFVWLTLKADEEK